MSAADAVVVGGSVAALVAADALARQERPVTLYLPARGVGSGFLAMPVGERRVELGPRLIELAYDDDISDPPPLSDYVPGPHGHRPYLRLVSDLVADLAGDDLCPVRRPELTLGGRRVEDFLLGGNLVTLPDLLTPDDLAVVALQAGQARFREGPAGLLAPEREAELWACTYADASVLNHGLRFHRLFIEPIAGKILEGSSSSVVAALRRRIWLPLFHPATIEDACRGRLTYRPQRPMHTLTGGGMGLLVERLLARLQASPFVTVAQASALSGLPEHAIVGLPPEDVFDGYHPTRVPLAVAWIDVREDDVLACPSVLLVAGPDVPVYRISENRADRVPGVRTFCVELHHATPEPLLEKAAIEALWALGLVRAGARCRLVRAGIVPAFTVPSQDEVERFTKVRAEFDALELPVQLVGGAAGFLADSFNEQIVQGVLAASQAP